MILLFTLIMMFIVAPVHLTAAATSKLTNLTATQGSTIRTFSADRAIDGNTSTFALTKKKKGNWLQIELPDGVKVTKIVITGRAYKANRLKKTSVYLSDSPYSAGLDSDDIVAASLKGRRAPQTIDLGTGKEGKYLIFKGDREKVQLAEVEVYGISTDTTPPVITLNGDNPIKLTVGDTFTDPGATATDDVDGAVTVNISGSVDTSQAGAYTLTYTATDTAGNQATATRTVEVTENETNSTSPYQGDIAHAFGIATQGTDSSYAYYKPAGNAIDGDLSTFNHTSSNDSENWLQIALPKGTKISQIKIKGRRGFASRLTGAVVAVTTTPYSGSIDSNDIVKTLATTSEYQDIDFSPSKQAEYVIVKAKAGKPLHLEAVEVYGEVPDAPCVTEDTTVHMLPGSSAIGTAVATVEAYDCQGDTLHYSVDDAQFAIDDNGNITVATMLNAGEYTLHVSVSDGVHTTTTTVLVTITDTDAIAKIVQSGDILSTPATENEFFEATLDEIESAGTLLKDAKEAIMKNLDDITWDPSHDSAIIEPIYGFNTPLILANAVAKSGRTVYHVPLATIGQKNGGNYVLFASNPMRTNRNGQMDTLLENTLTWLTGRNDLKNTPFKVVIAHLVENYWFKDESETRNWLDDHYSQVSYNAAGECDNDKLAGCLSGSDKPNLLIISLDNADDNGVITQDVNDALASGIPVLYMHVNGDLKPLGKALFNDVFQVQYKWDNEWKNLMIKNYDPTNDIATLPEDLQMLKNVMTHFKNNDYDFDWSHFDGTEEKLSRVPGFYDEFYNGVKAMQSMFKVLDTHKVDIFKRDGYTLYKLLALTADKLRQGVTFPLPKNRTDDNTWTRSIFADFGVYNYREIDPAQPDLGNFSRNDFSHVTPTTVTVSKTSRKPFRSTGVYCLPGKTMKVTRTDNHSTLKTSVFVNSLRPGSTKELGKYRRPKYLQSVHISIEPGESIYITSPYGGPVEIGYNINDIEASFTFENVGQHPYWSSSADDATFQAALDADEYDWAELSTPGFEVHAKTEKMKESIQRWAASNQNLTDDTYKEETASNLAHATVHFTSNYPFGLAGFKSSSITPIAEVVNFANDNGLNIRKIDFVKHMNSDQATCGIGCSGNPYDAFWAFRPTGHGDIHEIGHSLQTGRFQLIIDHIKWVNHAATNPYAYYTKSKYYMETGGDPDCQKLPFEKAFAELNASVHASNPAQYMYDHYWKKSGWSTQFMMTLQSMMSVQQMGEDGTITGNERIHFGWHLLTRVHVMLREFQYAKGSDSRWNAKKAALGLANYSRSEANKLSNNDIMLIFYSKAAYADFRDYWDMWGVPYSAKAAKQVADFNYPQVPRRFFFSTQNGYCKEDSFSKENAVNPLDKLFAPVDGQHGWPLDPDGESDS